MTTYRIRLGELRIHDMHHDPAGYIMKHTGKSEKVLLKKREGVADFQKEKKKAEGGLKAQCRKAKEEMEKYSLALEKGPYADADGKVRELAENVLDQGEKYETIEAVIDVLRPYMNAESEAAFPRHYVYEDLRVTVDPEVVLPTDGLITAGEILAEDKRVGEDRVSGQNFTILVDDMEAIVLQVSVLRHLGIDAYPALAVSRTEEGEITPPIIAVLEPESETPLITFNPYIRSHPPVEAVDLMSDTVMQGAMYALMAANEAKKFANKMVEAVREKGERLSKDEIESELDRIGGILFECHKRWEDSPMIQVALNTLGKYVYNAITVTESDFVTASTGKEEAVYDPTIRQIVTERADNVAGDYRSVAAHKLTLRIAKEEAKEEEKKE